MNMNRELKWNSTKEDKHVMRYQSVVIPLYGTLNIEDSKTFKKEQRAIFQKCFFVPCPYHISLDNFKNIRLLGEGGYGQVYLVMHKKTEKLFAMKVLQKKKIVEQNQISSALNEKRILQSMNYPFVVRLEFLAQDKANLYYFLPFITEGDVFMHLKKLKRFSEHLAKFYAGQVILALEFLHYCNLVYRDLKPENLLLDHTGYIKVTDFGFAKEIKSRLYTFCGTPEYIAPEIILGLGHGKPVDYWSLGVFIYEMVNGRTPFQSEHEKETYKKIVNGQYEMPGFFSKDLQDLISNLLQGDITFRYGNLQNEIEDIKQHRWFKQIDWLELLNRRIEPPYNPKTDAPLTSLKDVTHKSLSFHTDRDYDEYFKDF